MRFITVDRRKFVQSSRNKPAIMLQHLTSSFFIKFEQKLGVPSAKQRRSLSGARFRDIQFPGAVAALSDGPAWQSVFNNWRRRRINEKSDDIGSRWCQWKRETDNGIIEPKQEGLNEWKWRNAKYVVTDTHVVAVVCLLLTFGSGCRLRWQGGFV